MGWVASGAGWGGRLARLALLATVASDGIYRQPHHNGWSFPVGENDGVAKNGPIDAIVAVGLAGKAFLAFGMWPPSPEIAWELSW